MKGGRSKLVVSLGRSKLVVSLGRLKDLKAIIEN